MSLGLNLIYLHALWELFSRKTQKKINIISLNRKDLLDLNAKPTGSEWRSSEGKPPAAARPQSFKSIDDEMPFCHVTLEWMELFIFVLFGQTSAANSQGAGWQKAATEMGWSPITTSWQGVVALLEFGEGEEVGGRTSTYTKLTTTGRKRPSLVCVSILQTAGGLSDFRRWSNFKHLDCRWITVECKFSCEQDVVQI